MNSLISLFCISLIFGLLFTWLFEKVLKNNKNLRKKYYKNHNIVFGFHFHHSTYGIFFIIASALMLLIDKVNFSLISIGFAIGIIIIHTISEGRFIFVERRTL